MENTNEKIKITKRLLLAYENLHKVIYNYQKNGSCPSDLITDALDRVSMAKGVKK